MQLRMWRGRYVAVEVSARQRAGPSRRCRVARRDCRPARCAESSSPTSCSTTSRSGSPCSMVVGARWPSSAEARTGFDEVPVAGDPAWSWLPGSAPHGTRLPIQDQAAAWVARRSWRSCVAGSIVAFDYCTATTGELVGRPWREWLRTYQRSRLEASTTSSLPARKTSPLRCASTSCRPPTAIESQAAVPAPLGHRRARRGRCAGVDRGGCSARCAGAVDAQSHARERSPARRRGLGAFDALSWLVSDVEALIAAA